MIKIKAKNPDANSLILNPIIKIILPGINSSLFQSEEDWNENLRVTNDNKNSLKI